MKTLVCMSASLCGVILGCLLLTGCGGGSSLPVTNIPASQGGGFPNDIIRVGDKITIQLAGVPDGGYYTEKQVPASGDITLNLLTQTFHAPGKTTSQLSDEITAAYKSQKIYTNPVVTVLAEERFITVGGDVRSPSNVAYRPDLTLVATINSCGGFTEFANRRSVRVIRGKDAFYVDCIKAAATPGADPAVYPGDQIYVPRTAF
jgi:protein involved in polysaccharide export with SLBB domain